MDFLISKYLFFNNSMRPNNSLFFHEIFHFSLELQFPSNLHLHHHPRKRLGGQFASIFVFIVQIFIRQPFPHIVDNSCSAESEDFDVKIFSGSM